VTSGSKTFRYADGKLAGSESCFFASDGTLSERWLTDYDSNSRVLSTYGLKAANYESSLAAGRPMLDRLRRSRVRFGSTECSTCRIQMEDAAAVRTLHPAQYLALAYGYLPELRQRLQQPLHNLVLR